tara:strand:+ start:801 stop:971 length:171 start_codon:yes stop_codon:yes gene_type:complete
MGRMKEIYTMLESGSSVGAIAEQLQKWNRSIDRKTALAQACKFMLEWRDTRGNNSS